MPNVYIEARPKGLSDGERIDDYVVEDHQITSLLRSSIRTKQFRGPRITGIIPWSPESGI
jgi:hypothetical protein